MSYYVIEDFRAGVDTRRHPATAAAGTLRDAVNCHVTQGGEIEKRKAFVEGFDVTGTFGLANIQKNLYVFGTAASGPSGTYGGLTLSYKQLSGQSGTIQRIASWDIFDDKIYVVAVMNNGGSDFVAHFYDGAVVSGAQGTYVKTHQSKMYSVGSNRINFSTVGDPTDWATTTDGAGYIIAGTQDGLSGSLWGLESYYDQLAVFSKNSIQLWSMDEDPLLNFKTQVLENTGLWAPNKSVTYGSGDVLFLSQTGVRSLQARDSSNAGAVSDIGSPIDPTVQSLLRSVTQDNALLTSRMISDTATGRFWLPMRDQIWVLSLFPGPKVTAWSEYLPETVSTSFTVSELVDADGVVVARGTDGKLYVYGGSDGLTYDATEASFQTPYLSLDNPVKFKGFRAVDATLDGQWTISASFDPNNIAWDQIGTFSQTTVPLQRVAMQGSSPLVSLKAASTSASAARVANMAVHYTLSRED